MAIVHDPTSLDVSSLIGHILKTGKSLVIDIGTVIEINLTECKFQDILLIDPIRVYSIEQLCLIQAIHDDRILSGYQLKDTYDTYALYLNTNDTNDEWTSRYYPCKVTNTANDHEVDIEYTEYNEEATVPLYIKMEDYCIPTVIKLIPAKNSNPLNELLLRQCYNPKPLPTSSNLRADTDSLVDSLCEDFELLDAHPKPRTINVKMGSRTVKKLVFDDGFSFKDINIAVKKDFAMKYLISFVDHGNGVHEWGLLNSKSAGILITLIQKHVLFKEQYFYCPIGIKQSLVPVTSRENVHFSGYYQCLQKDCRHGFTVTISLRNIILNGSYVTVSLKSKNQCEHYNNFMAGFVRDCEAHLYGLTYAADEYNTLLANYNKSISIKYGNYAGVVVSNAQIRNIRRKNNAILSGNNVYSSIEEKFNAEINELTKKFKAKDMDQLGNVEGINYDDIGFIHDHVPAKCQLVLMHGAVTHILRKISKSSEHLILHMDDLSNVCKPTGRRLNHTVAYLPVKNKAPLQ
eukprot:316268_1